MALRQLVLIAFMSASIPVLAQEPAAAEEPQVRPDGEPAANADSSDPTQVAQATQSSEIQSPQPKKKEAEAEPEAHGSRLRWQDIPKNVLRDQKAIFTSPFHINKDNAKWWIGYGTAIGTLIAFDQKISDKLPEQTFLSRPSTWASRIGADYSIYPIWGLFYLYGRADKNPRARDTGRIGIEALIDADITVNILKLVTQRPRPEHQGDSVKFFSGGDAFPSGHSIKAWALARVAAKEFPDTKWVPIASYAAATVVSVARFGGRRHSASDALAGAAMGFFIGDFVYSHHHVPSEKSKVISWLQDNVHFGFQVGN